MRFLYTHLWSLLIFCGILFPSGEATAQTPCEIQDCWITGFGSQQRILWIPDLPGPVNHKFFFDSEGGHFDVYPDGTAHVYGNTYNELDASYEIYIDFWFQERMDWDSWSALGRSWKGNAAIVGDLYQTWDYYIMNPDAENKLVMGGAWTGQLDCTHKPVDYNYGFQVGEAANDQNDAMGMSCWMDYTGFIDGEYFEGNADINGEGDCSELPLMDCVVDIEVDCADGILPEVTGTPEVLCPDNMTLTYEDETSGSCPTIITRTWTVSLETGDSTTCQQQITVSDQTAPAFTYVPPSATLDCADVVSDGEATAEDACGPVEITSTSQVLDYAEAMCGQFRTQTPGGWGSPASGNNPGTYRDANFAAAFPDGLTIGCTNTITLTSAAAVEAFIPAGGTPAVLPDGQLVDPTGFSNTFASHLVTLKLTLGFDAYDPNFSEAFTEMGDLVLNTGAFAGTTLADLILSADEYIGGCSTGMSASDLTSALTLINENYVDGTTDNGDIDCPLEDICATFEIITWIATDACGNTSTATQTLIVEDTAGPEILTDLEDITVNCGEVPDPFIEVTDCGGIGEVQWTVEENTFSGTCIPTVNYIYTVVDGCGNVTTASQFITVVDTEAPVILNVPEDLLLTCDDMEPGFALEISDNCSDTPEVIFDEVIENNPCGYVLTQTWTVVDGCENQAAVSRTITVEDTAAPELVEPLEPISISCTEFNTPAVPAFVDDCSEIIDVQVEIVEVGSGCSFEAQYIWTATDACGQSTTAIQDVSVTDANGPEFYDTPASIALECGQDAPIPEAFAIDDCGSVLLSMEEFPGGGEGCESIDRIWTATDNCGNETEFIQSLIWLDEEAPVLSNVPADVEGACGSFVPFDTVTVTDNCDTEIEIIFNQVYEVMGCTTNLMRTWTAIDACGNETSATQAVVLSDNLPPIFSGDTQVQAQCGDDIDAMIEVTDDCQGEIDLTFTETIEGDDCNQTINRIYTAVDACGNTSTFEQTIILTDEQPPMISEVAGDLELGCTAEVPTADTPVVTDNCTSTTLDFSEVWEGEGCGLILIRTWLATDGCGNVATAEQVLHFGDTAAPEISGVPAAMELSCGDVIPEPATVVVTDDCDLEPEVSFSEESLPGACEGSFTILRTWTAIDDCGNTAFASQVIEVSDTEGPVFDEEVSDITADCGDIPEPPIVTATDACSSVTIDFQQSFDSGGCPNITRIWIATDACGNSVTMTQLVSVTDTEPPVLEGIPAFVDATCNNIPDLPEPEVSDNCDEEVSVTYTENVMGTGCEFTVVRTWIASDDCGNTTILSQSVNVTDEEAPIFVTAPPEMTLECSQLQSVPYPNVSDDCGATILILYGDEVLGSGCTYDILRTWTAADACGNTTSATQLLHVVDQTPPMISGIPPNTYVDCNNVPDPVSPIATDACSGVESLEFTETQTGSGCEYQLTRVWTATDACGNAMSIARLIFVQDNDAPVFYNVPDDITFACADGTPPEVIAPEVSDNCTASFEVTFSQIVETIACGEILHRFWYAADECGNIATAEQTITIADTEAPELIGVPAPVQVACEDIPEVAVVTAEDGCNSGVFVEMSEEVIGGTCPYILRRTWTASDFCGNVASATQDIEVIDNEAPILFNTPNDVTVNCGEEPIPADVQATDNCLLAGIDLHEEWIELGCVSTLRRTWTASDQCGNTSSFSQLITVLDQQGPTFDNIPEDMVVECSEIPEEDRPVANDDCSFLEETMDVLIIEGDCPSEFTQINTWTATDICGNATSISQIIDVVDTTAPVWDDAPEDLVVQCHEVPEVPEVDPGFECSPDVDVTFEEVTTYLEDSDETVCALGNTVTSVSEVAIWLPGLTGFGEEYVFSGEGGTFTQDFAAGTATITGQVYDPNAPGNSWMVEIFLEDRQDWDTWSANGGGYKDDFNMAGDLYTTWDYYKLTGSSRLIGTLNFEGSSLNLTHAPGDYSFGFQVGLAANNRNAEDGMSGWFFYEGDVQGTTVTGTGDVMTENQCCADQDIVRTWTLVDCSGNAATYSQTIQVRNEIVLTPLVIPSAPEEPQLSVWGTEGESFRVAFNPPADGDYLLTICDGSGHCVHSRDIKEARTGERIVLTQPKGGLSPGAYHFHVTGNDVSLSDKELVLR